MLDFDKLQNEVLGWLTVDEAKLLYKESINTPIPKILELGSFVGKSTCVLASGIKDKNGVVVSVDYFPNNVKFWNKEHILIDNTLNLFWNNLNIMDVSNNVIALKTNHINLSNIMSGKFGLIFIDGGHTTKDIIPSSLYCWEHLVDGGALIFHDYNNNEWKDVRVCVNILSKIWNIKIEDYGSIAIIRK